MGRLFKKNELRVTKLRVAVLADAKHNQYLVCPASVKMPNFGRLLKLPKHEPTKKIIFALFFGILVSIKTSTQLLTKEIFGG